jgi:hypothetical protein
MPKDTPNTDGGGNQGNGGDGSIPPNWERRGDPERREK